MPRIRKQILGYGALLAGLLIGLAAQAAPGTGLSACLAECKRARLSATDRASCKLDCETEAASDPALIKAEIDRTVTVPKAKTPGSSASSTAPKSGPGCKAACDADSSLSVDDRESCKLDCDLDNVAPVHHTAPHTTSHAAPHAAAHVTPPPPSGPPMDPIKARTAFLDKCYATCKPQGPKRAAETNAATCRLDCDTVASVIDVGRSLVPYAFLEPDPHAGAPAPATLAKTTTPPDPGRAQKPAPAPKSATPAPKPSGDLCGDDLNRCNQTCARSEKSCERSCSGKGLNETDRETCKLTCSTDQEVCQGDCLRANAGCVNRQRGG